ncbi:transmembrane protein 170A-like [Tubulanus polymorphus]|uniref:transmembrane protein 170A-like n=1 Tax=Tubulanus polymorphus TaxID=672921 RepID=UPI003DA51237
MLSLILCGPAFMIGELGSIKNVIGLQPNNLINKFAEIWYQVFLWALFSSIFVHTIAAAIAFCRLQNHKIGRFIPIGILVMGVVSPLTGGVITSAVIAGVYRSSGFTMAPLYCLVYGVGQTILVLFISFTRILATL